MCGLFGMFDPAGIDPGRARAHLNLMAHRGPDAEGLWLSDDRRLALGHRRLKILDLSDGANQPMVSPCGRWVIVFNGEIVNFRQLRTTYDGPWRFRTDGDTELLLALLVERGVEALHDCVGMFAFALHDRERGTLLLGRDRFGIKPLYLARKGESLAFASEIPPLLAVLGQSRADDDVIFTYLETGAYDCTERTFFRDVHSVEAGTVVTVDIASGALSKRRWYVLADHIPDLGGMDDRAVEAETARLIEQAVRDHMVADVPVGLNVSGGVDSSTLVGVAKQSIPDIHLFTQDYEPPYSEGPWVREVADGCTLHMAELKEHHIRAVLDRTVALQAEPFGGVFVCGYDYLYALAHDQRVTVLLDGNGVDETFLGYQKYHAAAVRMAADDREWADLATGYHAFWGQQAPARQPGFDGRGQSIDGTQGVQPETIAAELRRNSRLLDPTPADIGQDDPIKSMAASDLLATKIPRGLRFNDRMSMGRSKELRVPFLDHRLVEFGFAIPTRLLLDSSGSKALFRRTAERWIPPKLARAVKRSVQSPQREWLAGPWRSLVADILASPSFAARGWVDPARAHAAFEAYLGGNQANSFFLWQWVNLELWARRFLDGESA